MKSLLSQNRTSQGQEEVQQKVRERTQVIVSDESFRFSGYLVVYMLGGQSENYKESHVVPAEMS